MEINLLMPPVSFLIILFASWLLSYFLSFLSFKKKQKTEGSEKAYACGEAEYDNMVRPDYSQFFMFAFFFTFAHVATLIVTTMPRGIPAAFFIAVIYILAVLVSLMILFRSWHEIH
jgi:NADH:ubiquinone oxidoreductase subunit 3 (subunit A)